MSDYLFQQQESSPSGSGSLPDANTAEAILFGPSYTWIKSALWVWDEMEDYLLRKADSLDSQIMDREWAYDVMRHNRYLIYSRSPPVNEVAHLKDLFTLRALCKCIAGIQKIDEYRKQNKAWARMKGIDQYVKSMSGRGISESEWKAATASYNMEPINYDYVHGITPSMMPGEYIDWNEAMIDLMGEKEYDKLIKKLTGMPDYDGSEPDLEDIFGGDVFGGGEPIGEAVPEEDECGDSEDVPPSDEGFGSEESDGETHENPEQDAFVDPEPTVPEQDPFWDGFDESLKVMFSDPITQATGISDDIDDELSAVADYWQRLDIDNRAVIDALIGFAEAMA